MKSDVKVSKDQSIGRMKAYDYLLKSEYPYPGILFWLAMSCTDNCRVSKITFSSMNFEKFCFGSGGNLSN